MVQKSASIRQIVTTAARNLKRVSLAGCLAAAKPQVFRDTVKAVAITAKYIVRSEYAGQISQNAIGHAYGHPVFAATNIARFQALAVGKRHVFRANGYASKLIQTGLQIGEQHVLEGECSRLGADALLTVDELGMGNRGVAGVGHQRLFGPSYAEIGWRSCDIEQFQRRVGITRRIRRTRAVSDGGADAVVILGSEDYGTIGGCQPFDLWRRKRRDFQGTILGIFEHRPAFKCGCPVQMHDAIDVVGGISTESVVGQRPGERPVRRVGAADNHLCAAAQVAGRGVTIRIGESRDRVGRGCRGCDSAHDRILGNATLSNTVRPGHRPGAGPAERRLDRRGISGADGGIAGYHCGRVRIDRHHGAVAHHVAERVVNQDRISSGIGSRSSLPPVRRTRGTRDINPVFAPLII